LIHILAGRKLRQPLRTAKVNRHTSSSLSNDFNFIVGVIIVREVEDAVIFVLELTTIITI